MISRERSLRQEQEVAQSQDGFHLLERTPSPRALLHTSAEESRKETPSALLSSPQHLYEFLGLLTWKTKALEPLGRTLFKALCRAGRRWRWRTSDLRGGREGGRCGGAVSSLALASLWPHRTLNVILSNLMCLQANIFLMN